MGIPPFGSAPSPWRKQDGFVRPKDNTSSLYIGSGSTPPVIFGGEVAMFENDGATFYDVIAHGDGAYFVGVSTGGSTASPSASAPGNFTGFLGGGYGDSGYTLGSYAPGMFIAPTSTWTDSSQPSILSLGAVTEAVFQIDFDANPLDSYIFTDNGQITHSDFSADRFYLGDSDNSYFDTGGRLALADGAVGTPSLTNVGDLDTGIYFPSDNVVGITAEGIAQAWFGDTSNSPYAALELMPTDRTIAQGYPTTASFIKVDNTYTLSSGVAVLPPGYDFGPTAIFAGNGFGFGSGFLFWNHMLIQNDSGSTRSMGGIGGYIDQTNIQANGGSLTAGFHSGFFGQPTFNRINSGTLSVPIGVLEFWSNGFTIGAGASVASYVHFGAGGGTNAGTLTNQVGFVSSGMTAATNNTDFLIGTQTTGNWGIYQSTTTLNHFSGDVEVPDEAYGSGWNASLEVPTKNAIYDALNDTGKGFINHGATASTARPVGFASVTWYGSVEPSNMITGDEWIEA